MTERELGLLTRKRRGSWPIIVWDPRTRVKNTTVWSSGDGGVFWAAGG